MAIFKENLTHAQQCIPGPFSSSSSSKGLGTRLGANVPPFGLHLILKSTDDKLN